MLQHCPKQQKKMETFFKKNIKKSQLILTADTKLKALVCILFEVVRSDAGRDQLQRSALLLCVTRASWSQVNTSIQRFMSLFASWHRYEFVHPLRTGKSGHSHLCSLANAFSLTASLKISAHKRTCFQRNVCFWRLGLHQIRESERRECRENGVNPVLLCSGI